MCVSLEFRKNVENGDVVTVRSALLDYLIIDTTFKTFDNALQYAQQKLPVIVEYDKKQFENDTSKWDIDYLNKQKVALMINFSLERIRHVKNVITAVLPKADVITQVGGNKNRTGRKVIRRTHSRTGV